jgi:hypothetical protein
MLFPAKRFPQLADRAAAAKVRPRGAAQVRRWTPTLRPCMLPVAHTPGAFHSMLRYFPLACLLAALAVDQAAAQQPTQAQRDAIRAACRSDFMANCSGVQPGGRDALECLQRNLGKLSAACQSAVTALVGALAPAPAAPAATAPTPPPAAATPPAAASPTPAPPVAAPKPAPRPAAKANLAPPPSQPAPAPQASPPAASATVAPTVAPLTPRPFILPQRRLLIVRICHAEAQTLCADVPPGGGRIIECLGQNAASLSPTCYDAVARVSQ